MRNITSIKLGIATVAALGMALVTPANAKGIIKGAVKGRSMSTLPVACAASEWKIMLF